MDIYDVSMMIDDLVEEKESLELNRETRVWFRDEIVIPVDSMISKKLDSAKDTSDLHKKWHGENKLIAETLKKIEKIKIIIAHRKKL